MKNYKELHLVAALLMATPAFATVNCGALAAHMAMHLKIEIEGRGNDDVAPTKGKTLVSIAENIVQSSLSKPRQEIKRTSPELFQWSTSTALDELKNAANFNSTDFFNRTYERCLGRFYR